MNATWNEEIINTIVSNMQKMTEEQAVTWLDEMRSDNYSDSAKCAMISRIWLEYKVTK